MHIQMQSTKLVLIQLTTQKSTGTETFEKGKDFTFTATVTVKPEPKLGEYKGLEVTKLSTEVTDEEIEEQIQAQLAQKAELEIKEDGAMLKMATQL